MSRLIFPNSRFFGGNGNLYAIKLIAGLIDKIVFRIFKSGIAGSFAIMFHVYWERVFSLFLHTIMKRGDFAMLCQASSLVIQYQWCLVGIQISLLFQGEPDHRRWRVSRSVLSGFHQYHSKMVSARFSTFGCKRYGNGAVASGISSAQFCIQSGSVHHFCLIEYFFLLPLFSWLSDQSASFQPSSSLLSHSSARVCGMGW